MDGNKASIQDSLLQGVVGVLNDPPAADAEMVAAFNPGVSMGGLPPVEAPAPDTLAAVQIQAGGREASLLHALKPSVRDPLILSPAQYRGLLHEATAALQQSAEQSGDVDCQALVQLLTEELQLMNYVASLRQQSGGQ